MLSGGGSTSNWTFGCNFAAGPNASIWSDDAGFDPVTNTGGGLDIGDAVAWLQSRSVTVTLPARPGKLIAWDDATLDPSYVGYLMTDGLWAAHALKPFDPTLAGQLQTALADAGWYGNDLHDTLFHDVPATAHRSFEADPAHGTLLGDCQASNGEVVQVRTPIRVVDPAWTAGNTAQFIDSAVYEAMNEFWGGHGDPVGRIVDLVQDTRSSGPDNMFWDLQKRVFVDVASRPDYDNGGTYTGAMFKIGLALYAIEVMGITSLGNAADQMRARLAEAQWTSGADAGGVPHGVVYNSSNNLISRGGATGEATSIAIMSYTVR